MKSILRLFPRDQYHLGILVAVASAFIFGMWPPAARGIYQDGGNVSIVIAVALGARIISMGGFCLLTKRKLFDIGKKDKNTYIRNILASGFTQFLAQYAVYCATEYLPGPIAIIILFTHSLMLLFFMAWRGEVKLDRVTVLSTMGALLGLSFVVGVWQKFEGVSLVGVAWGFCAAIASVMRLYAYNKQMRDRHPIVVGAENFIVAAFFMVLVFILQMPALPHSSAGYGWIGLLIIVTGIGTFAMFYGIALLGSFRFSLFIKLEPVFTAIFSYWFIGEILKPEQYLGMGLVLASLIIFQVFEQRKLRKEAAQQLASPADT